jgi:hypothetical protein
MAGVFDIVAGHPFGLTPGEAIVLVGAVAYVVSLAKDWRPIRNLRVENQDLRQMLVNAEKKIESLESQVAVLQKATDLTGLLDEHKKIASILDRVVKTLDSLDGAVKGNTAAIEAVARGSVIRQTLEEMGDTT